MSRVFVFKLRNLALLAVIAVVAVFLYTHAQRQAQTASGTPDKPRLIHMVTGEFKSTTADGTELEAYRWDPGTVFVQQGETVKLVIYGVNGASHPFMIEGMNISGEVRKGEETTVTFTAEKKGVFRLICTSHPDKDHGGPMIAYIVVM